MTGNCLTWAIAIASAAIAVALTGYMKPTWPQLKSPKAIGLVTPAQKRRTAFQLSHITMQPGNSLHKQRPSMHGIDDPALWVAYFFMLLLIFAVIEHSLPRTFTPPKDENPHPPHTLIFADGNPYEVSHSTTIWVYAGCFWQEAVITGFNERSTDVMFANPEGGFSAKRYSCGSWRFMPFDELKEPNFIPNNPAANAAIIKTTGDFHV